MSKKVIKNWISLAEYDFETAKAMLKSGRYLYVAFTCQQTIEKILKAFYVKERDSTPPRIHNLIKLVEGLSIAKSVDGEANKFLERLNPYYIQPRYMAFLTVGEYWPTNYWPENYWSAGYWPKGISLLKSLDKKNAKEILSETEDLFQWLKTNL